MGGIVLSANDVVPVVGTQKKMINKLKSLKNLPIGEESPLEVVKPDVLSKLTDEANAPAKQSFRFSSTQVSLITHMMDKHGTDYKAMSRDPKNLYQETPAKLRGMIRKFISIPEHYAPYCKERGLITPSEEKTEPPVDEVESSENCAVVDGEEDEVNGDEEEEDKEDDILEPDSSGSDMENDD